MIKLSFMTFVCPEWEIEKIVEFAKKSDYDGVEIRVDEGHKHDISSKSSQETRQYVRKLFVDNGLEIPCIATSVGFGYSDPTVRRQNIDHAKANLDLAADLGAKVVRIFANGRIPALTDESADYIAQAFDEVGEYSKELGVCPMLECGHDIIKSAVEADQIIKRVKTSNFCVLWNHSEMDETTFNLLRSHVRHFHVHDEVLDPNNENILHLSRLMKKIEYDGYFSLEIIKGKNLPEDLLIETARRLKEQMAKA